MNSNLRKELKSNYLEQEDMVERTTLAASPAPSKRHIGFPNLKAQGLNWGRYFAGMGVEIVYGFVLIGVALLAGYIVLAVFQ